MVLLMIIAAVMGILIYGWPMILAAKRRWEEIREIENEKFQEAKELTRQQKPRVVIRKPAEAKGPDPIYTATFWWKRLFRPQGILGGILLFLWVPALLININFLTLALEIVTGSRGSPLWVVEVFGVEVNITYHNLFAGLLALCQAISGAIVKITSNNRTIANDPSRQDGTWVKGTAIFTLTTLLISTVGISSLKGYIVGGIKFAVLNGVLYLAIALVDILCGILVIANFIDFILATVYSLIAPGRWLLSLGKEKEKVSIEVPVKIKRPRVVSLWYKMALAMAAGLAYLLEPLMGSEAMEEKGLNLIKERG